MNRILVYTREFTLNVQADEMIEEEGKLKVYSCGTLVGVFDLDVVQAAYLTPKRGDCK